MISPRRLRPLSRLLIAGLGLLLANGCANYHLGTGAKLTFTTLYVAPVETKVILPQAQAILSTQIRNAFARDARVTLVNTPEGADAVLRLAITDYRRDATVARENDTGLARKFALTLGVTCTLHDNRANRDLFADRPVSVQRDAFTDSGQLQSEYQTLPFLAEALAAKVTHTVLDVW